MNFETVGGRTFLLTVGCGLASSVLLWFGKLDSGSFAAVIGSTVSVYIGANAYQGKKVKDGDQPGDGK